MVCSRFWLLLASAAHNIGSNNSYMSMLPLEGVRCDVSWRGNRFFIFNVAEPRACTSWHLRFLTLRREQQLHKLIKMSIKDLWAMQCARWYRSGRGCAEILLRTIRHRRWPQNRFRPRIYVQNTSEKRSKPFFVAQKSLVLLFNGTERCQSPTHSYSSRQCFVHWYQLIWHLNDVPCATFQLAC
jgi:hypothetical protein